MFQPAPTHRPTRAHRTRSASAARQGFTLIELMIVVAIVGIIAAAIVANFSHVLATNRQSSVPRELANLLWRARVRAIETGGAVIVRFDQTATGGLGGADARAGMTNRCLLDDWQQVLNAPPGDPRLPSYRERFSMAEYNPRPAPTISDVDKDVIALHVMNGGTASVVQDVCYEPNGAAFERFGNDPTAMGAWNPVGAGLVFEVERFVRKGGVKTPYGVVRKVEIAPPGFPRIL